MSPDRRRTNGVLWDVLAPWVRWPLHSPRRLFCVLAGIVLAAVLWHALSGGPPRAESPSDPTATAVESGSSTTPPTAYPTVTPAAPVSALESSAPSAVPSAPLSAGMPAPAESVPQPSAPAGSAEAARGFVTAWAQPALPADQWLAGVRGYVTPELERSMSYTDPARIPASQVTGPATMVQVMPDGTATSFEVPTNGGPVRVDLALLKGRWLATDIVPASVTAPGD